MELLLTSAARLGGAAGAGRRDRRGPPTRRRSGARRRRGCWPSGSPSSSTRRAGAARETWSCCCAPPGISRSSSARSSCAACAPWPRWARFWGHRQIGDLLAYLRALANPLDEQALYGVLASPLGGCSLDCLALLARAARAARTGRLGDGARRARGGGGARSAGSRPATAQALESFCAKLESERTTAGRRTISELIERAVEGCGYREHVLGLDWGERRLANVHKLLRLARRFEASEGRDLRGFLDHVEHLKEAVTVEPDAPVEGVEPDAVRLMTVHAAKGLEFPVVCLADLGRAAQHPDARPARGRRPRRPAPGAPGRRRLEPRAGLRGALARAPASGRPKRRTGSSTSR